MIVISLHNIFLKGLRYVEENYWLILGSYVLSFVHLRSRVRESENKVLSFSLHCLFYFVFRVCDNNHCYFFLYQMGNIFLILRTESEEMNIFSKPEA
jgi:hypothetical protein